MMNMQCGTSCSGTAPLNSHRHAHRVLSTNTDSTRMLPLLSFMARMTLNNNECQTNTSQNEGIKTSENDKHNVTTSGGNCDVTAFLRLKALLNHTQSTSKSRGQASHPKGWKALGMAAQPALTWATLQLITIPSIVIKVLQPGPGWSALC